MRTGISITITRSVRGRREAITRDRNASQKHAWRGGDHPLERRRCWHQRDHAPSRQVEDLVWRWRERFMKEGIDGLLQDKTRPSRIPPLGPEVAARVVALTLADPPVKTPPPLDKSRSDGTGERHQRQRGPAYLEGCTGFSRTVIGNSSSRTIRTSSTSCATWSGSMSIRRPTPSCFRSTRRAKSRLSIPVPRREPGLGSSRRAKARWRGPADRHQSRPLRAACRRSSDRFESLNCR